MNRFPENKERSFVFREIDGAYIVWVANGNQYLQLEEPAFFVFQHLEQGTPPEQIAAECAKRYHNTEEKTKQFVSDIGAGIETIRQTPVSFVNGNTNNPEIKKKTFVPYSTHSYRINGKHLRFCYETRLYEYYLHPLLQHLESQTPSSDFILFELFADRGNIVLRVNNQLKGIWKQDETHLLKGMVFLQLLNAMYDKNDSDWMAVVHASAVTNGNKTIVFTAAPGSGKSTIAALLQQKGFTLVSDDFVPVEGSSRCVFPFPAALSVKEGANEMLSAFYPSLKEGGTAQRSLTNKMVKYVPVEGKAVPAPVKEVFFIQYHPEIDFNMERLPRASSLKLLLDEAWTFPSAENASRFLEWYSQLSCYRLSYSNNEKALDTITKLFEE
jgi:hypothetical protein